MNTTAPHATIEMPEALAERIQHGLRPAIIQQDWVVKKEDPRIIMRREYGKWIQDVSQNEALFKKHVYENDDVSEFDLRQHRQRLYYLLSIGELLAMGFIGLVNHAGDVEASSIIQTIDQANKKLFDSLVAWYGSVAAQSDLPEDLKQSIQEFKEGKVVELDI